MSDHSATSSLPSSIMLDPLPEDSPSLRPFRAYAYSNHLLQNPDYYPIGTWSRLLKPTGEDGLFAGTLATATTIPHCLTLRLRQLPTLPAIAPTWPAPTANPTSAPSSTPPDVFMLLALAATGICGHPSTVHGGIVATCIDEAMSLAVTLYAPPPELDPQSQSPRGKLFTSQLDVRYKRPVSAPGLLAVRAKVVARVGRKFWVRAQVLQEDEENPSQMVVTTDAMAFWLQTTANL
ncbi:hypothetical protein EYZ11_001824 [Aspergillus tanneri]|uniref:Thioesterase domain-containing protein n=1 Tax=Aspergillus tanneri TaxID=1220188 RepID=A0A4S3JT20_9EURO|nr:uncharacterized protein ATNIH1004_011098 [Aspergillus tanneri]KAA8642157.1 hypothetical protein ATNIH1004_011098 [Aspergillus tanneri]THC98690.1 hypothetical protein EYZ11_001824 [Aspergillus tanneri]